MAAIDPAGNVGKASKALMIPVKMTTAEFEVEVPTPAPKKNTPVTPGNIGAITGGIAGVVSKTKNSSP